MSQAVGHMLSPPPLFSKLRTLLKCRRVVLSWHMVDMLRREFLKINLSVKLLSNEWVD